jgi:LmbE family N-acetylglucosaminyl deacetylase
MMEKLIRFFLFAFCFQCFAGFCQTPATFSSADIFMQLKKLNVLGSVLYIAAHPDDENNTLLPYLAKEKLYRTGYLSLTRGDGGQNLIGSEQGVELGLIRTQELLAARRIDGAEQFFSRAYEFGFSKSAEEALKTWGKDKILSDVVWVIRKYQPDVIIKRFPPDKRAGHGHHAASAILADEAFKAAADAHRFPKQFKYGVKPWQAKRILWNTFNFGGNNTTSEDQLKIDVSNYNPLIGKSYGELGGEARSMHKSQGTGSARRRGQIFEYFATTGGSAPKNNDLMDGVVTGWKRAQGGEKVEMLINNVIADFKFDNPALSVHALVKLYTAIKALPESNWRTKKLSETQQIIEECAGLFTEVVTQQEYAVQGDSLKINFNFSNRSNIPAAVKKISVIAGEALMQQSLAKIKPDSTSTFFAFSSDKPTILDSAVQIDLEKNQYSSLDYTFKLGNYAALSQPYWLEKGMKQGYFDVDNPLLIGQAENKPGYVARFTVQIEGREFEIERPLQCKYTDPVKGEVYEPLTVIPKLTISISPTIALTNVVPATNPLLTVNYVSNINASKVPVTLTLQNGSRTDVINKVPFNFKKGVAGSIPVKVKDVFYQGQKNYLETVLALNLNGKDELFSQNIRTIKYEHIPFINYFYRDNLRVVNAEIKTVGKKIGYITGPGDKVPDALSAMGYDVKFLNEAGLNADNLRQFDAVIVGVRAYNIYEYLSSKNDILNGYIQSGGNVIVQYMKSAQWGSNSIKAGPYPFNVSSTRVTEENAKVDLLLPKHSVFNYPNKITEKDFEGWVQERSTYQADQSDEHYEKLISMNDEGEQKSNGSLIIAKYGKGNFAYVSLVLFRQLPAGVPGAYRLLANLIALPKNK